LTLSFLKNTTLKQLLTEGEKFVMTFFNAISFAEQGVYDVINNIGSLPARLVFQQIEENGFLLFSQKIDREKSANEQNPDYLIESSFILKNLLKLMILIGFVIFIFGFNYSELALLIYGGKMLSEGIGTNLLQLHCIYIIFIAINGVTECFTFAAMNSKEIDKFNKKMINISVFFLTSSYILTKLFGCKGFIMSNCLNMGSRIFIRYSTFFLFLCNNLPVSE
jgi:oligosaccharide translocation protein RFT1